ncbi:MobB protein [Candidatus Paraburkholderia calva]|nr:MobB protein [Candidatus Paraburkholderia calva]
MKAATKAYIAELTAEIKRLLPQRPAHVTVGIDELKFLACAKINDALATIRQNRCNLLLAAQSIANLEAPDDKRLDGKALAREFEVNTPIKFVYRAADERTAEWAEKLSASQWLNVVQRETTKTNVHGGEQWEGHRGGQSGTAHRFAKHVAQSAGADRHCLHARPQRGQALHVLHEGRSQRSVVGHTGRAGYVGNASDRG